MPERVPPGWQLSWQQYTVRPVDCLQLNCLSLWAMQGVPRASALTSWVVTPQALLWRNWKLKKRSWASTVVELLSPIVLVGLLVSK